MLGFEATGGYAPAKVSGETINETNTNLLVASARLLLALSPVTNRVGFYIAAGPALLTRGKNPFDDDKSRTDFGANVGLGFRFGLGQTQQFRDPARRRGLSLQRRLRRWRRLPERPRGVGRRLDPARRERGRQVEWFEGV